MNDHLYLVVMAGGTGTRLWPQSRQSMPKQFLDVMGNGRTLLQETLDRFQDTVPKKNQIIASNESYQKVLKKQLPKFSSSQFYLEPSKKNTAPCIAYAAYKVVSKDPDALLIITPADHAILDPDTFIEKVNTAVEAAMDNKLITIGIEPDRPETGYGYIQYIAGEDEVKRVKTFTEKPEKELAEKFIESGDFVWNAGIFVWRAQAIIEAFEKHQPELAEIFAEGSKYYHSRKEKKFVHSAYAQCRNISIDYAIMEKAENVYCVLGDFGWSDLGSWQAIHEHRSKDKEKNAVDGDVMLYNSKNNFVHVEGEKTVIIDGLEDYIVMELDDVLAIVPKNDSSKIQKIIKDIKKSRGEDLL